MTREKAAGGGDPSQPSGSARVTACTGVHLWPWRMRACVLTCNSAPCDMLGGLGGRSPAAPGHIWVVLCPSGRGEACQVGCMAHRGAGAPLGAYTPCKEGDSFEESVEGSGVSKGQGPKCILSASPLPRSLSPFLGTPSGTSQARLPIPVSEQRLSDAEEGRQGRSSHYGSYNNNNKKNAIQKV